MAETLQLHVGDTASARRSCTAAAQIILQGVGGITRALQREELRTCTMIAPLFPPRPARHTRCVKRRPRVHPGGAIATSSVAQHRPPRSHSLSGALAARSSRPSSRVVAPLRHDEPEGCVGVRAKAQACTRLRISKHSVAERLVCSMGLQKSVGSRKHGNKQDDI